MGLHSISLSNLKGRGGGGGGEDGRALICVQSTGRSRTFNNNKFHCVPMSEQTKIIADMHKKTTLEM